MPHLAQDLRGRPTGNLKIGTVLDPATLRVGELMLRMLERHPQLELDLHQVMSSDGIAGVRNGTLDASFYFGEVPAELTGLPLRDVVYRVTMPVAWADRLADAPWELIAQQPWIVAPEPSSHYQLVLGLFGEGGLQPERIIEADTELVINNLVESGVGISLIRDEFAAGVGRLRTQPDLGRPHGHDEAVAGAHRGAGRATRCSRRCSKCCARSGRAARRPPHAGNPAGSPQVAAPASRARPNRSRAADPISAEDCRSGPLVGRAAQTANHRCRRLGRSAMASMRRIE